LLTGSLDGTAVVQEVDTGRIVTSLRGHTRGVNFARFSSDGANVVTTSQDATARYWDATGSGQSSLELPGHVQAVTNVAFSPDATRLVTASGDDKARVWDIATGRMVLLLEGHDREVSSAVVSADGTRIVTGSWDGRGRSATPAPVRSSPGWSATTGRSPPSPSAPTAPGW
jgi:WD40 repeat protein